MAPIGEMPAEADHHWIARLFRRHDLHLSAVQALVFRDMARRALDHGQRQRHAGGHNDAAADRQQIRDFLVIDDQAARQAQRRQQERPGSNPTHIWTVNKCVAEVCERHDDPHASAQRRTRL